MSEDTKIDPKEFRSAAGRFATGITVVTVAEGAEVRGMTANSFVSISLDPPLVLISVANTAEMNARISKVRRFGVSVLDENQQKVSNLFAGGKSTEEAVSFQAINDTPVIENSLAVFACDLHDQVVCGDHTLFVGRVRGLDSRDGDPLLYYASSYNTVGKGLSTDDALDLIIGSSTELAYHLGNYNAVGW